MCLLKPHNLQQDRKQMFLSTAHCAVGIRIVKSFFYYFAISSKKYIDEWLVKNIHNLATWYC